MPRKSPNRKFWSECGVLPAGDARADAAMVKMLEAVEEAGDLADRVFRAALFQSRTLPTLAPEARERFGWKPPKAK